VAWRRERLLKSGVKTRGIRRKKTPAVESEWRKKCEELEEKPAAAGEGEGVSKAAKRNRRHQPCVRLYRLGEAAAKYHGKLQLAPKMQRRSKTRKSGKRGAAPAQSAAAVGRRQRLAVGGWRPAEGNGMKKWAQTAANDESDEGGGANMELSYVREALWRLAEGVKMTKKWRNRRV